MNHTLTIRNWQRTRAVDLRLLRRIIKALLAELLDIPQADLGIHLVAALEMTRFNETFLQHKGSTDVITFDYSNHPRPQFDLFRYVRKWPWCFPDASRQRTIFP